MDSVVAARIDPLLCDMELPLAEVFHPAGFPLRLASNSREVMEAAKESWGGVERAFDTPALEFQAVVEAGGGATHEPGVRKRGHLLHFVSDAHNFAVGDSERMSATFHLSEATVADRAGLRWYYLEALAYMLLTQRYVVSLHAGCVSRDGQGILICGGSGSGKSTLSFACARAGFTFLADDSTWIRLDGEGSEAIGKPQMVRFRADAARHFPELAGHTARLHPSGKCSIELPVSLFPAVRTEARCPVRQLVFLDRESEGAAGLDRMTSDEAIPLLLADLPSYGAEVNEAHERAICRLAALPAFRLRYRTLDDAVRLMAALG
jgi:hypothetical protein